jgi:hypothetical protein
MAFKITHDTITPALKKLRQRALLVPHHLKRMERRLNRFSSFAAFGTKKKPHSPEMRLAAAYHQVLEKERLKREIHATIKAFMTR